MKHKLPAAKRRKVRPAHHWPNVNRWYRVSAYEESLYIFTGSVGRAKSCYFTQLEMHKDQYPDIRVRLATRQELSKEMSNNLQGSFIDTRKG